MALYYAFRDDKLTVTSNEQVMHRLLEDVPAGEVRPWMGEHDAFELAGRLLNQSLPTTFSRDDRAHAIRSVTAGHPGDTADDAAPAAWHDLMGAGGFGLTFIPEADDLHARVQLRLVDQHD